jgi:hypothetical protein
MLVVPSAYPNVVEREGTYFFRRHADGRLCDGHLHDSLAEAQSYANRTELDPLWSDLAKVLAEA